MMDTSQQICHSERRRDKVREEKAYGLDYLEVCDDRRTLCLYFMGKAPPWLKPEDEEEEEEDGDVTEVDLPVAHVRIEGGRRITDLKVIRVTLFRYQDPAVDDFLKVILECPGDFSPYTLSLVRLEDGKPVPPTDLDPRYDRVTFNFNIEEQLSDLDCKQLLICPQEPYPVPEIDYLAKDYASFRQLILDRLALTMPDWKERHVPDLGITLVELLAYVGDHLSYYQDSVATEAYLDTARQRISVRRHARLVDYHMHEGCNARAWVFIHTDTPTVPLDPQVTSFITGHNDILPVQGRVLTWDDLDDIPPSQYEVFEPLVEDPTQEINLYPDHNKIEIYTWGDKECCLPVGTTGVTLKDGPDKQWPPSQPKDNQSPSQQMPNDQDAEFRYERKLKLQKNDVIIFEEVLGPKTGNEADADPAHRQAVRLTEVNEIADELYGQPLLEVSWAEEDALPFPLCISAIGPAPECKLIENISIARGNIILVDHGRQFEEEDQDEADKGRWCVPIQTTVAVCEGEGRPAEVVLHPGRFRPFLKKTPITFSQAPQYSAPASKTLAQDPHLAVPWIRLSSAPDPDCLPAQPSGVPAAPSHPEAEEPGDETDKAPAVLPEQSTPPVQDDDVQEKSDTGNGSVPGTIWWTSQQDLLNSDTDDPHFVAEIDNRGRAHLRFGDGELGRRPEAGTRFSAIYRVGNGLAGNVGAEAISHVVLDSEEPQSGVSLKPRNPMPAQGGLAPESMQDVKMFAPHAFRQRLERAITADDYAQIVMREFGVKVQRAAAALRWTGSWYEALVAVDQRGSVEAEERLLREVRDQLRRYRRIGHDVVVKSARLVPLNIKMEICVKPEYLSGHVQAALLATFSNRNLPDGRRGFFHPDELTFGEGIYISKLVATAQAVAGVESAVVKKLERLYEGPNDEFERGLLSLGPLEVAQLDNDPNFPENGQFELNMRGGR